jgi:enoyl-CoA hydratase/carnithine racemase
MTERVLVEIRDQVAYVTLNRPEKYNALDFPMFHGLVAAAEQVAADRTVRAVVLSGAGKAFCAGLDFPAFGKVSGVDRARSPSCRRRPPTSSSDRAGCGASCRCR